jgi:hypothetical protein
VSLDGRYLYWGVGSGSGSTTPGVYKLDLTESPATPGQLSTASFTEVNWIVADPTNVNVVRTRVVGCC